jgi:hypothetical protein
MNNQKSLVQVLGLMLIALVFTACGTLSVSIAPTATYTPVPLTVTPTPKPPTDTPTPEPTDTLIPAETPTPIPTSTLAPTDTPTPTKTPTLTPTYTAMPTETPTLIPTSTIDSVCGGTQGLQRLTVSVSPDVHSKISYATLSRLANHCYKEVGDTAFVSDLVAQGVVLAANGIPAGTPPDYELVQSSLESGFQMYVRELTQQEYTGLPVVDLGGILINLPTRRLVNIFPGPGGVTVANVTYEGKDGHQYKHLDAGPPDGVNRINIPASGQITYHFKDADGNDVLVVRPDRPLEGIVEAVQRAGIDPQKVTDIQYHIGHCTSDVTSGYVNAGMEFCTRYDRPGDLDIVTYVIRVITASKDYQISPCLLTHEEGIPDWCLVCAPDRDCNPNDPLEPVIKDH